MPRLSTLLLTAVVVTFGTAGCIIDFSDLADDSSYDYEAYDQYDYYGERELDLRDPRLSGDMVGAGSFDHLGAAWGTTGDYWSTIEIEGAGPDGAAMMIFTINGSIDDPRFAPGTRVNCNAQAGADQWGDLCEVWGCIGPEPGWWDYDEPAMNVVIDVSAHPTLPDARVFDVSADFGSDGKMVSTFAVAPLG